MTENDLIALHEAWYAADDAHQDAAAVCYDLAVAEAPPEARAAAAAARAAAAAAARAARDAWVAAHDAGIWREIYRSGRV
jgi:hypothetical protein